MATKQYDQKSLESCIQKLVKGGTSRKQASSLCRFQTDLSKHDVKETSHRKEKK
jgi:hypothetical protein